MIRNLKINQNRDFELNILSAEIDEGLWDKPKYNLFSFIKNENDVDHLKTMNAGIRFNNYEGNFEEALNYNNMISLFPNKFKNMPYVTQYLDELYVTYVSILIMQDRENDAILMLD